MWLLTCWTLAGVLCGAHARDGALFAFVPVVSGLSSCLLCLAPPRTTHAGNNVPDAALGSGWCAALYGCRVRSLLLLLAMAPGSLHLVRRGSPVCAQRIRWVVAAALKLAVCCQRAQPYVGHQQLSWRLSCIIQGGRAAASSSSSSSVLWCQLFLQASLVFLSCKHGWRDCACSKPWRATNRTKRLKVGMTVCGSLWQGA